MKSIPFLAAVLAIKPVYSHGGIYNYTIDGIDYAGHYPWLPEEGQVSVQRRWWPDPIFTEKHPYLACNRGNPLATTLPTLHAPVRAGAQVTAWYFPPPCPVPEYQDPDPAMRCSGPEYQWVHHLGPLLGPCDQWDGHGKRWFKIWEAGYNATGRPGSWKEGELSDIASSDRWWHAEMVHKGINVTIPKTLKAGHYLIRHEVINIEANLQLYPECAQLEVSGDGSSVPGEEYLVEFPGAYKAEDPGIWIAGQVYSQVGHSTYNYTMPGPKVWVPEESN
ncbi:lytic polysaccharide monooxygenase [Hypomontagnella monticulosa]|nr:lytic polysaccharide monooxygenase [Hypomontagnella monticulosa]